MNKYTVLRIFGGNMQRVADAVGCSRQNVQLWPTDKAGNITSRRIADSVLAAMVREYYRHRQDNPDGVRFEFDEEILRDLLTLPDQEKPGRAKHTFPKARPPQARMA